MISPHALESALSKIFDLHDPLVANTAVFDERVKTLLTKRPAIEGLLSYFQSRQSAPRICAVAAYSSIGSARLAQWIDSGKLSADAFYLALMHDGSNWLSIDAPLLLASRIVSGDQRWDYDLETVLGEYTVTSAFPGLVDALIARCRIQGRMRQVFIHIPMETLLHILERAPDAFSPELKAMQIEVLPASSKATAMLLIRQFLSPEECLAKMLNAKLVS